MDGKILSPFILQTPSVQAQNHKFHPFFSPFFSYFTSIYDLAYNLLQKAQLPSVLLNLHFFFLSEIAKVSGVCCYIASEKLVTLKGSHPFSGDKKKFTKLFFFFSFFFFPSLQLERLYYMIFDTKIPMIGLFYT